ncbi:MAG: dockerin type I domain-containing protein [Planctomycetota bacterium]
MNDPSILGWADSVVDYSPAAGVDGIWQTPNLALGPAVGTSFDIVTLGDNGTITLGFDTPITNGPGFDFAVFENAFDDDFLELAFVEVSSDGQNFVRFANDSLTPDAVGGFDPIGVDATNLDGLAGKYRQGFGTPFDLDGVDGVNPLVDVAAITHVRVVDILGDGSVADTSGDPIYDPFPTFGSPGFDLDAVAVLHQASAGLPADANADGVVDLLDFDVLAQNFGSNTGAGASAGDFNADGVVDLLDFDVLAQNFGSTSPAIASGPPALAVPEPASAGLLFLPFSGPSRATGRRRRALPRIGEKS